MVYSCQIEFILATSSLAQEHFAMNSFSGGHSIFSVRGEGASETENFIPKYHQVSAGRSKNSENCFD